MNDTADRPPGGEPRPWLPSGFAHPQRVDLRNGAHLRPIRGDDVEIDYPAVMGSRQTLWGRYGSVWGWPSATMTLEQDRADLERHEREISAHESFNYAVLDDAESRLFGCIYIDPPEGEPDCDALVSWWVVDECRGTPLETELDALVPRWVITAWPFAHPRFGP